MPRKNKLTIDDAILQEFSEIFGDKLPDYSNLIIRIHRSIVKTWTRISILNSSMYTFLYKLPNYKLL